MLGHRSAALTLDTYADLFPDDLEAVADAFDAAVAALPKPLRANCGPPVYLGDEMKKAPTGFLWSGPFHVVGVAGFEPTTSSSRTKRATKLRHTPREASTAYRT